MRDLRPVFGRRVRALRTDRGLSQEQLAEAAGLHWTYVSGVERGLRNPTLKVIGRIAVALRTNPCELFRDDEPARPTRRGGKGSIGRR